MNLKKYFLTTSILLFVLLSKTSAYNIYFGFTSSIFDAESNSRSGTGWNWDHTTQTLTLDQSYNLGFIDSDCTGLMTIKYSGNVSILANTNVTISVDGQLHLIGETGAQLTLSTDMSASWYLLDAKELTITGGTLICTGGYGIYTSDGDVTIDGATVTTTSSDSYGYGIRAKGGDINILNASVLDATGCYEAIFADKSINIIESNVNLNNSRNLFTGFINLHMTGGRLSFNGGTPPTLTSLSPASGPDTGGTDVTLTGDNFTGATTMKVGNAIYYVFFNSFSIISPTKIEFTTRPETAGLMDVYVQTPGGVAVLKGAFTYQSEATINIAAIQGISVPDINATPITTITETGQYTGTVSWSPAHNPFQGSTQYTATITLTPKAGYKLNGIPADYFTVAGAINVTNAANSGVITAIFPVTQVAPVTVTEITTQPSGGSICLGSDYTFEVVAEGDDLSYQWYKGNNKIEGAIHSTLAISNASFDDYEIYYVEVSGADRNTVSSEKVRLWVADPLPSRLSFIVCPSAAIVGHTYPIKLAGYADVTNYTWSYSGDGVTFSPESGKENETNARFSAWAVGKGTLSVELEHVCGNRTVVQEIEVRYPSGLDVVSNEKVRIWPNPVVDQLNIESGEYEIKDILVTDLNGRIIFQLFSVFNSRFSVNCSGWGKGVYLVRVKTDAGDKTIKVLKK